MGIEKYELEQLRKPNKIVASKFKSTLLEQKITSLGINDYLYQKQSEIIYDDIGRRIIRYTGTSLKKQLGAKSGGIYEQLKKVALSMRSRSILIEDVEKHSWKVVGLVSSASFNDGIFEIVFEPEAEFLINENNKFTFLEKDLMMQKFTSIYAFRLYELINMELYKLYDKNSSITLYYTLNELRFNLCTINTQNTKVQNEMVKENADLNKVFTLVPKSDIVYKSYDAFKRNVIVVGVDQISKYSNIDIEYEEDKGGRGAKVQGIWFTVKYKDSAKNINFSKSTNIKEPDNIDDLVDDINDYITNVKLKIKDIKSLLKEADYESPFVKQAYDNACNTKEIPNFMGWMINCIRGLKSNTWSDKIKTVDGDNALSNTIDNIKEEISKPEVKLGAWNKLKSQTDFSDFIDAIGLPIEILDMTYTPDECIKLYVDWKLKR